MRMNILGTMVAGLALSAAVTNASAEDNETIKIGVPVFLSGAAAGPFGQPEKEAAELLINALNEGSVPEPYAQKGFAGDTLEATFVDEAANPVTEYRNLVDRDNVDAIVGYTSSGNCKSVAPLADDLEMLTVFVDCGTPQIFEEIATDSTYLFRTGPTGTIDSVGAARYFQDIGTDLSRVAGINQNYGWGQDAWRDFTESLAALDTDSKIVDEQFPKVYSGQYGSEISALLTSTPTAIHTSFWGGDLEAFLLQSAPRGLFARSSVLMTCGEALFPRMSDQIPEGAIIGARGPYSVFAPKNDLSTWFNTAYEEKFGQKPTYPAWKMAQAIFGLKAAWEKSGEDAEPADVAAAFENLEFESPAGTVKMAIGNGHQAIQGIAYGKYTKSENGKPNVEDVISYSAECVNPPNDMKAADWIEAGFPNSSCE